MKYMIDGNELVLEDGIKVTFDYPIEEVADAGDRVVVVLDPPSNVTMLDNVFAADPTGDILWQIKADENMGGREPTNSYIGILRFEGDAVWLAHLSGDCVKAALSNGQILSVVFQKY